jgi:hypothetical protein
MKKLITALALIIGLVAAALVVGPVPASAQPMFVIRYCDCIDVSDRDARLNFIEECDYYVTVDPGGYLYSFVRPVSPVAVGKPGFDCGSCDPAFRAPTYFICTGRYTEE